MTFDSEPGEAILALERVAGRPPSVDLLNAGSSRTPGPEVQGAGSFRACGTKLEAAIGSQRTALARARRRAQNVEGLCGVAFGVVVVGLPAYLMGITHPLTWLLLGIVAVPGGVWTLESAAVDRVLAAQDVAHADRLDALRRVLERLEQAADPASRLEVRVDLATADQAPPRSKKAVPFRFRTELGAYLPQTERSAEWLTRHRHRWAEVAFVMACASPIRLVLADEVDYHGVEEVRRTSGLSGHITPNPEAWRLDELPEAFDAGPLRVVRREIAGRTALSFRGALRDVQDLPEALDALHRMLPPQR
jgi:hypothetical protein